MFEESVLCVCVVGKKIWFNWNFLIKLNGRERVNIWFVSKTKPNGKYTAQSKAYGFLFLCRGVNGIGGWNE